MKRFFCLLVCSLFILSSCGYKVHGTRQTVPNSIFGNGTTTVAITKIEDPSLYPWINYYLTNAFHTEMNFRKLAKWEVSEKADYHIEIILHKFDTSASLTDEQDNTLLNTVNIQMEVRVKNIRKNTNWSTGILSYYEYFQLITEVEAVREILQELVYLSFNAFENNF